MTRPCLLLILPVIAASCGSPSRRIKIDKRAKSYRAASARRRNAGKNEA